MVIVIFTVLIGIGMIFLVYDRKQSATTDYDEASKMTSIETALVAQNLPEIVYVTTSKKGEMNIDTGCIDIEKVNSFRTYLATNPDDLWYFDRLSYSTIILKEVYPSMREYEIYSREPEGSFSTHFVEIPVSVYYPVEENYNFGILQVEVYS